MVYKFIHGQTPLSPTTHSGPARGPSTTENPLQGFSGAGHNLMLFLLIQIF